jgi:hypothetical protein
LVGHSLDMCDPFLDATVVKAVPTPFSAAQHFIPLKVYQTNWTAYTHHATVLLPWQDNRLGKCRWEQDILCI